MNQLSYVKELYEPLWDELYLKSRKAGFKIGSIWIADVAHQGRSSVLNEDMLGNDRKLFSRFEVWEPRINVSTSLME